MGKCLGVNLFGLGLLFLICAGCIGAYSFEKINPKQEGTRERLIRGMVADNHHTRFLLDLNVCSALATLKRIQGHLNPDTHQRVQEKIDRIFFEAKEILTLNDKRLKMLPYSRVEDGLRDIAILESILVNQAQVRKALRDVVDFTDAMASVMVSENKKFK